MKTEFSYEAIKYEHDREKLWKQQNEKRQVIQQLLSGSLVKIAQGEDNVEISLPAHCLNVVDKIVQIDSEVYEAMQAVCAAKFIVTVDFDYLGGELDWIDYDIDTNQFSDAVEIWKIKNPRLMVSL